MKPIDLLIGELKALGIKLWVKDDKLGCDMPKGVMTPQIRDQISSRKQEIMDFLHQLRNTSAARQGGGVQIPVADRNEPLPLSFAQQSLWFLATVEEQQGSYNEVSMLDFQGHLVPDILVDCLHKIVERHEILRTVFKEVDGKVGQVVQDMPALNIAQTDLSQLSAEQRDGALEQLVTEAASTRFDLGHGPLLRAELVRLKPDHHRLLMVVHHIIVDHWSTAIVQQELAACYGALCHQQQAQLPPNRIQYGDFAAWQRQNLDQEKLAQYAKYWLDKLDGAPRLLELPGDYPRPAVKTNRGDSHFFNLSESQIAGIRALSQRTGATHFMTLLATFFTLLHRYSAQQDICIGTPVANREDQELRQLVGLFVNTLVIRQTFSADESFLTLLGQVRQTALDAYSHQEMPFEKLVELMQPTRTMSHTPLFQVAFAHQVMPDMRIDLPELTLEPVAVANHSAKFDLTLFVEESEKAVKCTFEYSTDLFSAETIERMTAHFCRLLDAVIVDPELPLNRLPMLTAAQVTTITEHWNATAADLANNQCLQQLFDVWVDKTPDAVAVVCDGVQMRYGELAGHARKLGARLHQLGARPNELVAVVMPKSWQQVAAVYGVLYSGAAYVPIDPKWPQGRREQILKVCDTRLVVTVEALMNKDQWPDDVTLIDIEQQAVQSMTPISGPALQSPSDLAYVIFTSGSTGAPKGVVLDHRGPVNTILDMNSRYQVGQNDSVYGLSMLSFDLSVYDIFGIHAAGGKLVMPTDDMVLDADHWRAAVEQHGITLWDSVPALMQMLVESGENAGQPPSDTLRLVIMSGDWIPLDLPERIWRQYPKAKTFSQGGATEASIWSISYPITEIKPQWNSIPYGRPMANQQFFVLNEQMEHCPVRVPGQLFIGGIGVAQGYWKDPERTAASYLQHPSLGRLYRTGDLGCYDEQGVIRFLGRVDFQVKVNGYRIELGEIEACLAEAPGIEKALVEVKADHNGHRHLVAYFTGVEGLEQGLWQQGRQSGLQQLLSQKLPDYMVPKIFVAMGAFPLSANGKVDRKALPEPDFNVGQNEYVAPQSEVEITLCHMLESLMQRENIGLSDNFFSLGGHSLLATQWVSRIRHHYNIDLALYQLFGAADIAAFAQAVEQAVNNAEGRSVQLPELKACEHGTLTELSYAQQRLWFIDQYQGGSANYNIPVALEVTGPFEPAAALAALQQIVERHQVLRSVYLETDDGARQRIEQNAALALPVVDLTAQTQAGQQVKVAELMAEDARRPFDLSQDLMLRAQWLMLDNRPGSERGILLFNMHHIASDGWSMSVLVQEFVALYHAQVSAQPAQLEPLKVQYADYALWQREYLATEQLQSQLDYWSEQLADAPAQHSLALDFPRPQNPAGEGGKVSVRLSPLMSQKVNQVAKAQGVTPFILFHATLSLLLARHSNNVDIVIGTPVANRTQVALEPLIGFFVNTLVLRTNLSEHHDFATYLEHVKQVNQQAQAHQDVPFEFLVERLAVPRNTGYSPLFQIMLSMVSDQREALLLEGLNFKPMEPQAVQTKFDLMLDVLESGEGYQMDWVYDVALFKPQTIERLSRHFDTLLGAVVDDPDCSLPTLTMYSPEEQDELINIINPPASHYPKNTLIHQRVALIAARYPDKIAVSCEGEQLSYKELERRSNRLAHYLRAHGVDTETLVAISMERSVALVVGILAILKAGGAYVPLDTTNPKARLEYILSDSGVKVLLTQSHLCDTFAELSKEQLQFVAVDTLSSVLETYDDGPVVVEGHRPDHLAYVIYTSGSTGQPKGVLVEHHNVIRLFKATDADFNFCADDVWTLFHTCAFDISVWEIWGALFYGGRLVVVPYWVSRDTNEFYRLMVEQKVTVLSQTPSAFYPLIEVDDQSRQPLSLRYVVFGGEALNFDALNKWFGNHDENHPCMVNMYGITETTVHTTVRKVSALECRQTPGLSLIGRPMSDLRCYVLTPDLHVAPTGVVGELFVGGDGVARGYHNLPTLTAQRFIVNPFEPDSNERLYRSGDLVSLTEDGDMLYIGRADDQVKIRGFRVELGEVQQQINRSELIDSSLVRLYSDPAGDKQLLAYVKPNLSVADKGEFVAELRAELSGFLPGYMIPAYIELVEQWPLTGNGKLDKRALPEPESATGQNDYVAPESENEQALCELWQEVLSYQGERNIGITDNFFELGGQSLLAMRLVNRIRKQWQVGLTVRNLFEAPTVAELAVLIESHQSKGTDIPPLTAYEQGQAKVLSFAQQGLWMASQLSADAATYNIPLALEIDGSLNIDWLCEALGIIVERHEALRSRFVEREGQITVEVCHSTPADLNVIDLSGEADVPAAMQSAVQALSAHRFALDASPLFAVELLKLGADRHVLAGVFHHIICDGWSIRVLVAELSEIYSRLSRGETPTLKPLPVQYTDYAQWQRGWLSGAVEAAQLAYWQDQLNGVEKLPRWQVQPGLARKDKGEGKIKMLTVSSDIQDKLKALANQQDASLFMLLCALFNALQSYHTGHTDCVVGADVANRSAPETEGLIGFFVNQLVLRADLSGDPVFTDLLQRVKGTHLAALDNQDVPFETLVKHLKLSREGRDNPLFQVKMMLQPGVLDGGSLAGLGVTPIQLDNGTAKFDLYLGMEETAEGLMVLVQYDTAVFGEASIDGLMADYPMLMNLVIEQPDITLSALHEQLNQAQTQRDEAAREQLHSRQQSSLKGIRRKRRPVDTSTEGAV